MKILRLLAAVPLFTGALLAADQAITTPEELFPQLDAILKHAVAQSPAMISRATDLESAENDRIGARAGLLPSVGGYYNYTEASDDRSDQAERLRVQKTYYNFSIAQPLFHWGERRNNDRIGTIRLEMARRNYREGYRLLAQEIRTTYLVLIQQKLRTKRASLSNAYYAAQLKRGEDQLAKKTISEAQIFPIRLDADRAQITDEQTRSIFEDTKAKFSRLTGLPVLADDEIPDEIPAVKTQDAAIQSLLAGYLSQKDKSTAVAEAARKSLDISRLNLANARKRLYPKFNLIAGASQDEQSYTINVAQKYSVQSLYAGISLNWTIFDGFTSGAVVRSSLAQVRQLERDYRALDESLAQSAKTQVKSLNFTQRLSVVNDRLLESSEGNFNLRKEEFGRGVIAEEGVRLAEISMMDSRIAAADKRGDFYVGVTEFLGLVVEDPVLNNIPKQ